MRQWRLIYDLPAAGSWNMAVDEAILEAVGRAAQPPTLRLYAWRPACLSLGYGQPVAHVAHQNLAQFGWDLVRRPTGGRAILHTDELTYSLALPIDHELAAGSVLESYHRISQALLLGLQLLGVQPTTAPPDTSPPADTGPVCFETPSPYEITVAGRKLIGSAQVRRKTAILQHGTLPLTGDLGRIVDALTFADEPRRESARQQVRQRAITLQQVLGLELDWSSVADAIRAAFVRTFAVNFSPTQVSLSDLEHTRARQLQSTLYADSAWTNRR